MQELRLMNREFIDSIIRTDEGMKHLVVDGVVVCSAPIAFDFNEYKEEDAVVVIQGLMKHLWKQGVYMDDLNDEMIQPLVYQIAYEHAKQVVEDFNDEVYQCDMRECGEKMIELASWDKRFMDCI
jgi:hypothetical protein